MGTEDYMMMILMAWTLWFFCGGSWALFRLVIGVFGFKEGHGKWKGFKHFMVMFLMMFGGTAWFIVENGGMA